MKRRFTRRLRALVMGPQDSKRRRLWVPWAMMWFWFKVWLRLLWELVTGRTSSDEEEDNAPD